MFRKSLVIALSFVLVAFLFFQMDCTYKSKSKKEKGELYPTLYKGWAEKTVKVTGKGAPPVEAENASQRRTLAERAAKEDGYRKILEEIQGVQVSSKTYVKDFITESDVIRSEVEGFVRAAQVVDTRYDPTTGAEVDMELYLGPKFEKIIITE